MGVIFGRQVEKAMKSIGAYIIFLGELFRRMESFRTYFKLTVEECIKVGFNSIFIVTIISLFMGAVTTIQIAYNLISPFIPDPVIAMVARDMTLLELSPTIIALVFAGKVGSNIAGELGTMRITEQVDALEVMGINATSYLVLPKILASLIMFPMLVVLSMFLTIWGGYVAGTLTGVISGTDYVLGIRSQFIPFSVFFAIIKAYTFSFVVSSLSSFKGFYTKGGALEVGVASTNAVNNSCIGILAADYVLAQMLAEFLAVT